jgi:elongation factor Tu
MATEGPKASKPLVNIVVLGPLGHGKSTLTAALTKLGTERFGSGLADYDATTPAPEEQISGGTVSIARTEYESPLRECRHVDCPTQGDCIKAIISGTAPMDGVILVWSAADDPKPETSEELRLASQIGATNIVVFLNKTDLGGNAQRLELTKLDVRRVLVLSGFAGYDIPIIVGSARLALDGDQSENGVPSLIKLVDTLDRRLPQPHRDIEKPFLMSVEDVFYVSGLGTAVTGLIERGFVNVGDSVDVIGLKETRTTTVTSVEMSRRLLIAGNAGDNVSAFVRGLTPADLSRGQVLAEPGSVAPYIEFEAKVYMLSQDEGGRGTPFFGKYRPQLRFRGMDVTGSIKLSEGREVVNPGDTMDVSVALSLPIALEKGQSFMIYEGARQVGYGMVLAVTK